MKVCISLQPLCTGIRCPAAVGKSENLFGIMSHQGSPSEDLLCLPVVDGVI